MQIGLVTFHYNHNFGAALQCYALQKVLKELGHNVDIIDYLPRDGERLPFWRGWQIRSGSFRKRAKQRMLQLLHERAASRAFIKFKEEHWNQSPPCSSLASFRELTSGYDALICGSDQVWVFERPSPYFLDAGNDYSGLRISYAACCGHDRQKEELEDKISSLLNGFDSISVRNEFSKKIIGEMVEKEIAVVADPTVLTTFEEIECEYRLHFDEYILLYCLSEDDFDRQLNIIEKIKEEIGNFPVVSVVANSCPRKNPFADIHIYDAHPGQWVWLIANAQFVYTDSFHGVLLCCKYRKNFTADYKEKWRSLRLLDIARRYGIGDRIHYSEEMMSLRLSTSEVEYSTVHTSMQRHKEESIEFLKQALG